MLKGSSTSGNWGHSGRPGLRGGSRAGGGHTAVGATRGMSKAEIQQARDKKRASASKDSERAKNAKDMIEKRASAPSVVTVGTNVEELTRKLGLPKDFYTWERSGDVTSFGIRTETGQWKPTQKYLTDKYSKIKDNYDRAVKREDRRAQDLYYRQLRPAWDEVVNNARQQVIDS